MSDPIPNPSTTPAERSLHDTKPKKVTSFRKKWREILADPTACANVCIAIFAIATVTVSYFQWQELKQANQDNRDSLALIQRAFIAFADLQSLSHLNERTGERWWSFQPVWENSGNTPTRNMHITDNYYFESTPLPTGFSFPELPKNPEVLAKGEIPTLLGPKAQILGDQIVLIGRGLAEVRDGKKYFYIWGCARYHDIFNGTPEHITKFAFKVNVLGDPTLPVSSTNIVQFNCELLPEHNCFDQECDKQ